MLKEEPIRLTQYSHGAGCGCKISPKSLDEILRSEVKSISLPQLLVGNDTKDDAAVFDIGNDVCIVSTTDFFMPIVDDPIEFGRIAGTLLFFIFFYEPFSFLCPIIHFCSFCFIHFLIIEATNAISDIYAMGATPIMAIAILGWPINKISLDVARKVVDGGRIACNAAGIPLSGGHSIDSPEPIFGLAVTGTVPTSKVLYFILVVNMKLNQTKLRGTARPQWDVDCISQNL